MLPIALGMPVALTDHIDRGSKLLLRGRIGFVVAMDWSAGHKQPSVVFLKFDNVDWQLDGTTEPGIYPIEPVTRTWFLDRNKPKPVLKVVRRQLPLCPAFAVTAHFSQGKTMEAAILDLMIDKITDVSYGTVATSRVRSREDVLVLRPFPLWLHQRGSQLCAHPLHLSPLTRGQVTCCNKVQRHHHCKMPIYFFLSPHNPLPVTPQKVHQKALASCSASFVEKTLIGKHSVNAGHQRQCAPSARCNVTSATSRMQSGSWHGQIDLPHVLSATNPSLASGGRET